MFIIEATMSTPSKAKRRSNPSGRFFPILAALCLLLASCGKGESLFSYAVCFEENVFSPRAVGFMATVEEVLEHCGLSEDEVNSLDGQYRITRETAISGLPVTEIFSFAENRLVAVEYVLLPDSGSFEETSQRIAKEAAAFMPEQILLTDGGVKAGQTNLWQDEAGNQVRLSFPETGNPDRRVILLQICAAKPSFPRKTAAENRGGFPYPYRVFF